MTTNHKRNCFQAQNKLENLVIEQMWQACYAAQMDETENGFYMLWMDEKSVSYDSDKEKAMKVLNEYGYKFPEA
jgi:hypothetical protein